MGAIVGPVRTMNRLFRRVAWPLAAAAILGAGCGTTNAPVDPNSTLAVEKLYADGKDELATGAYDRAAKIFERVEGRAAGTLLAQQASLDLAYAQFRGAERAAALATIDRFIKLHPSSPALDYAYYLRGVVNFNDNLGMLSALSRQDLSERDQQASRDAYQAFRQVVEQFPQSRYASDARLRMDYIVNALADYELHVSRYYFRRAASRAQQVLVEFPQAPATEEALVLMVNSYGNLGLDALRADTLRVLEKNYPDSRLLRDGGRKQERAWWQFW
jgi:outer membrane protein assembly factor BamD